MAQQYKILREQDYAGGFTEKDAFALDVLVGLSAPRKSLPSKYFYDEAGSALFKKITALPEYYLTGCETEILSEHGEDIARFADGGAFHLIELGAGFSEKTLMLLACFVDADLDFQYVPIDISEPAMRELMDALAERLPLLEAHGLVSDYFNGIKWLNNRYRQKNLVLFLGSSIGNFPYNEARFFLRNLWNCLNHEDLVLIGFDMKKDIDVLLRAYNDAQGVTRAFNLNLLRRINRELGGRFDLNAFRHFGTYDVFSGAMESYLVSLEKQSVFIQEIGRSFSFEPWEPIHTEYSYKYLLSDIERLAGDAGFKILKTFSDSKRYFTDAVWRVHKPGAARPLMDEAAQAVEVEA